MEGPPPASRLRSAWQLARAELPKATEAMSTAASHTRSTDLGDPLGEALEAKRAKAFKEAYDGLTFETDRMPLARIIGRVYREPTSPKRAISTTPLKKDARRG